jgi:nucleotide-binding universal stress UspA family protein
LLALEEHGEPSDILRRSAELAGTLGLELEVLRVLRRRPWTKVFSRIHVSAGLSVARRSLQACRRLRAWCDEVMVAGPAHVPVRVRLGDFAEEASRLATEHNAQLLIVPSREGRQGARVIGLAGSAGCPVLVLRTTAGFRALIAATDLEHDDFPVLSRAVEVGQHLDAAVLAVHNVNPLANPLPLEASFATATILVTDTMKLRQERLSRAASQLTAGVQPVVSNQCDTVGAILRETDAHDRALVVVGTRTKPWINRLIVKSVAAEVVNRARTSVMVTPIRERPWFDGAEYQRRVLRSPASRARSRPHGC